MKAFIEFLAGLAVVVFGMIAIVFVVFLLAILFGVALIVWMCGTPITIKKEGRVLGYVRWFTFYTEQQWLMRRYQPR